MILQVISTVSAVLAALGPWGGAARDKLSKAMLDHFDAGNDGGRRFRV